MPLVFVSTQTVDVAEFLLVTGPGGSALPPVAHDHVGQYVSLEGEVERRGDLLVLRMDPASLQVLDRCAAWSGC